MKNLSQSFRSRVLKFAWSLVKNSGYTLKVGLRKAWSSYKTSKNMDLQTIKTLVKSNKQKLVGKTLVVNGVEYKTLNDFGNALLNLENYDSISCKTWREGAGFMCLNVEHSLSYSLSTDRFDKVIINTSKWFAKPTVNLDYSDVDFSKYGFGCA